MLFNYKTIDNTGAVKEGGIEAVNIEIAISSLQKKGYIISSIRPVEEKKAFFESIPIFNRVKSKDVVILSRQISTLFQAQVSALRVFKLLAAETGNPLLRKCLTDVASDIEGGSTISNALSKHSDIFNSFYISMVKSGEESGKLDETFSYLAEYLDRTYEVTSKAKNAFIYPAFVIVTFIVVMFLMFTMVIPKISSILIDSGQAIPFYTQIVINISNFLVTYGLLFGVFIVILGYFAWKYQKTEKGQYSLSKTKLSIPYVSDLYRKLYLSRFADNMNTMLASGISMVRALEITSSVIDNAIFKNIILESIDLVKGGSSLSEALSRHSEIPGILTQMIKVGEETGEVGSILKTLSRFYEREVSNAVDTLVGLIEPVMIVILAIGVGILLASVLMPIYNVALSIG